MQNVASVPLRIVNRELNTALCDGSLVECLSSLFCIEWRLVQNEAHDIRTLVASVDECLAIVDCLDLGFILLALALGVPVILQGIVRGLQGHRLDQLVGFVCLQLHVLAALEVRLCLRLFSELCHLFLEVGHVYLHIVLFSHELSEVNRKSEGSEEQEGILAGDRALLREGLELLDAAVEGPSELGFLLLDDGSDILNVVLESWEGSTQCIKHGVNQLVEETWGSIQDLTSIADSTAQNSAKYVSTALV
mmetsp:Transcript_30171/g.54748  ORF Transcript_30171/g.54748 Transcript_30171/m.54748 type:complete len:249 (-) Transcript_30171:1170-1916(-)